MNRKRKKDKNPDGTNPGNGLYEHPSVVAARGRKDANTPGGATKGSKPRRYRWNVDSTTRFMLFLTLIGMPILLSRVQTLWVTVSALIFGALLGLLTAREERKPWDLNLTLRYFVNSAAFVTCIVAFVGLVKAWS